MFDPAALGTLLIGLESVRNDARQTHPRREAGRQAARPTKRHAAPARRNGPFARLVGTLLTSILPQRAGYEKHQRR